MAVTGLLAGTLLSAGAVLAVHDLDFQLDGDTTETGYTLPPLSSPSKDWDSLFTALGANTSEINPTNNPGFTHGDFVRDFRLKISRTDCSLTSVDDTLPFCTLDTTTFATGSKDTLNMNPGWQCNKDNNVNSKIDIMNAYAAAYTAAGGDKILYFGLDKNKDNGNNNVGFWFLQGNSDCDATNGTSTFSGSHSDGDVLVVAAFTSGGGVSNVTAYRWAGGASGCIDSQGNADPHTGGCDGLGFGQGGDCKLTGTPDSLCATTNAKCTTAGFACNLPWNDNVTTKWLTSDATLGVGHTVVPPDFFEGGINLTDIFAAGGDLPPSCFNTFVADTRSSQSLTATLFDFARGQLGECSASITTQASTNGSVVPGALVHDTATITGTTGSGTPPFPSSDESTGGTNVKFYICELLASGACTSTAVQVGNTEGEELSPTATPGQSTATSDDYDTTNAAPGRYCFYAVWPGDSNYANGASGGAAATECFTVAKLPTTTVTTPGTLSGTTFTPITTIALGGSVVDRAVVTGSAAGGDPTGNVNFFVCAIASGTCATGGTAVAGNPVALVSDGVAATYTSIAYSGAFTPTAIGRYCFRAEYGGSTVYNSSSDSASTECFTVTTTSSGASAQRWLPNDRIVVTSVGQDVAGTLSITLRAATCTGTVVYTEPVPNSGAFTATTTGALYNTTNASVFVGTKSDGTAGLDPGTYYWSITFTPTNTLASGFTKCETSTLTINNNP
jgi:hypothetical protein